MIKRYKTKKQFFIFNMIAFLGFAFEFFIRGDQFLGIILVFNGIINLLAYQQAPRRVASITVILNLFNAIISIVVSYNYGEIDYLILFILWTLLAITYSAATIRQIYSIILSKRSRKKQKHRMS